MPASAVFPTLGLARHLLLQIRERDPPPEPLLRRAITFSKVLRPTEGRDTLAVRSVTERFLKVISIV